MVRWVLHVDLDQFIAAVEILRRPELRGRPVVVGGDGDPTKRGVVSTASYEARRFGVHSAMPLRIAARKCPDAVFLPVDAPAYEAASRQVMQTLRSIGGVLEVAGWDEAFLAVDTDEPEALAHRIQQAVRDNTRLECSVGIGHNKLQAKIATGFGKPGGVFRLTETNWYGLLGDRAPDVLWGIGSKTTRRLAGLGIRTVSELAAADPAFLAQRLGPVMGPWYRRLARGRDSSPVVGTPYVPRSRSRETTFQRDLDDWTDVRREVSVLAARVAEDVAAERRLVRRVAVKVRYTPFETHTHGISLEAPSRDPGVIENAALRALLLFDQQRRVRLVGVRAEFVPSPPPPGPGSSGGDDGCYPDATSQ